MMSAGLAILVATPIAPAQASEPAPRMSAWSIDFGVRYWYSEGRNKYDYFNDAAGTVRVSALDYKNLSAHSGEFYFRADHLSGIFVKGYAGAGTINGGELIDEDFPPYVVPYSNTISQTEGNLDYLSIDFGFMFFDSRGGAAAPQPGIKMGGYVGYHRWHEAVDAFGCTQRAGHQFICSIAPAYAAWSYVAPGTRVITEEDTWRSLRTGLVADVQLTSKLSFTGDIAYAFVKQDALDIHYLTFGPAPRARRWLRGAS